MGRVGDFLTYATYLANFDHSLEVLGRIQKKEKVASLLKEAVVKSKMKLDLGSYLIMPVQRLPRYELLLREVLIFVFFFLLVLFLKAISRRSFGTLPQTMETQTFCKMP